MPNIETVLSIGFDTEIKKTGSNKIADEDFSVIIPAFFFGKGFGDLNSGLLRPFAITGKLGFAIPTKNSVDKSLEWGFALEYSFQYLEAFVKNIGLGEPFKRMTVLIEFPFETGLNNSEGTTGYVSPGIVWLGKYFQIGAEAKIPINEKTSNFTGVVGIFHFFIDDIFPNSLGKPVF